MHTNYSFIYFGGLIKLNEKDNVPILLHPLMLVKPWRDFYQAYFYLFFWLVGKKECGVFFKFFSDSWILEPLLSIYLFQAWNKIHRKGLSSIPLFLFYSFLNMKGSKKSMVELCSILWEKHPSIILPLNTTHVWV